MWGFTNLFNFFIKISLWDFYLLSASLLVNYLTHLTCCRCGLKLEHHLLHIDFLLEIIKVFIVSKSCFQQRFTKYEFCWAYSNTMSLFSGASNLNDFESSSAIKFAGSSKSELHACTYIPWTEGSSWKFLITNLDFTAKRIFD